MTDTTITKVQARRVWDRRGNPTVEVDVTTASGRMGRTIAPAGASGGKREASDLRDGGAKPGGMDVQAAVAKVTRLIAPALIGLDVGYQAGVDGVPMGLDGTPLKSRLGGNATVATSVAVLHAGAAAQGMALWQHVSDVSSQTHTLPLPEIEIFGRCAPAGSRADVRDFMVMVPGASSMDDVMEVTSKICCAAGSILKARGYSVGVADKGGWRAAFNSNEQALDTLMQAIEAIGEKPGERVVISLDITASQFGRNGRYRLALANHDLDRGQMIDLLGRWIDTYPIGPIEDPLAGDEPEGMVAVTQAYGDRVQIIGDDYLATNARLVNAAARAGACNAVLIKVNQIGTITEATLCLAAAQASGYRAIVSARSGEYEETSISHLAVGLNVGQLKAGSITRSERTANWNECLRIAEALPPVAFVGGAPLANTGWGRAHSVPSAT